MLVTSTLVNGIAFILDGTPRNPNDPMQCWPLTPPSPHDLSWLNVQSGINLIFAATFPLADTSQVKDLFNFPREAEPSPDISKLETPPCAATELITAFPDLCKVCGITPTSTADDNPYLSPLSRLLPLTTLPRTSTNLFSHLSFISALASLSQIPKSFSPQCRSPQAISPNQASKSSTATPTPPPIAMPTFLSLLKARTPAALLVLAHWYANMCLFPPAEKPWWIFARPRSEGRAICIYLYRYTATSDQVPGISYAERETNRLIRKLVDGIAAVCGFRGLGGGGIMQGGYSITEIGNEMKGYLGEAIRQRSHENESYDKSRGHFGQTWESDQEQGGVERRERREESADPQILVPCTPM
jgi:hypothetical protein